MNVLCKDDLIALYPWTGYYNAITDNKAPFLFIVSLLKTIDKDKKAPDKDYLLCLANLFCHTSFNCTFISYLTKLETARIGTSLNTLFRDDNSIAVIYIDQFLKVFQPLMKFRMQTLLTECLNDDALTSEAVKFAADDEHVQEKLLDHTCKLFFALFNSPLPKELGKGLLAITNEVFPVHKKFQLIATSQSSEATLTNGHHNNEVENESAVPPEKQEVEEVEEVAVAATSTQRDYLAAFKFTLCSTFLLRCICPLLVNIGVAESKSTVFTAISKIILAIATEQPFGEFTSLAWANTFITESKHTFLFVSSFLLKEIENGEEIGMNNTFGNWQKVHALIQSKKSKLVASFKSQSSDLANRYVALIREAESDLVLYRARAKHNSRKKRNRSKSLQPDKSSKFKIDVSSLTPRSVSGPRSAKSPRILSPRNWNKKKEKTCSTDPIPRLTLDNKFTVTPAKQCTSPRISVSATHAHSQRIKAALNLETKDNVSKQGSRSVIHSSKISVVANRSSTPTNKISISKKNNYNTPTPRSDSPAPVITDNSMMNSSSPVSSRVPLNKLKAPKSSPKQKASKKKKKTSKPKIPKLKSLDSTLDNKKRSNFLSQLSPRLMERFSSRRSSTSTPTSPTESTFSKQNASTGANNNNLHEVSLSKSVPSSPQLRSPKCTFSDEEELIQNSSVTIRAIPVEVLSDKSTGEEEVSDVLSESDDGLNRNNTTSSNSDVSITIFSAKKPKKRATSKSKSKPEIRPK